ncbi:thiol:disulfide interchange, putative [Babesia ovata]|uniref:Thiol:disulfide interchange, putative n=1 Tax=Babesia ovata TaxID=189622 RepID=A0A2H6KKG9_9APIC|nr:thiol:disulfide interchange, putative [Babesia ovata]GBE63468.1 thiol:disulfide interchange, putative [Babesia ovata]
MHIKVLEELLNGILGGRGGRWLAGGRGWIWRLRRIAHSSTPCRCRPRSVTAAGDWGWDGSGSGWGLSVWKELVFGILVDWSKICLECLRELLYIGVSKRINICFKVTAQGIQKAFEAVGRITENDVCDLFGLAFDQFVQRGEVGEFLVGEEGADIVDYALESASGGVHKIFFECVD